MPGGRLHSPMWAPYKLYGEVDHVYGWAAWEANDGFTGAQSSLNVIEIVGYVTYLLLVVGSGSGSGSGIGSGSGSGSPAKARDGRLGSWGLGGAMGLRVEGRKGALAVLLGFALAVMTLSKTILYGKPFLLDTLWNQ